LAGGDVLSDLDGAIADDAWNGSNDFGVQQIQLGLIEISFLALRVGEGRRSPGAYDAHLLRCGLGVAPVGFGLPLFFLGLSYLRLGGVGQGASRIDRGGRGWGGSPGPVVFT